MASRFEVVAELKAPPPAHKREGLVVCTRCRGELEEVIQRPCRLLRELFGLLGNSPSDPLPLGVGRVLRPLRHSPSTSEAGGGYQPDVRWQGPEEVVRNRNGYAGEVTLSDLLSDRRLPSIYIKRLFQCHQIRTVMDEMARDKSRGDQMDERLTLTVEEAAKSLGIGRGLAYEMVRTGEIPTIRLGRRLLIPRAQLQQLLGPRPNEDRARNIGAGERA